ncbi:MAG: hypothetical protein K0U78_01820, partial [Actinomycetia bacterium]|nr:hypothetical protein [Actinomycetes bacterium]
HRCRPTRRSRSQQTAYGKAPDQGIGLVSDTVTVLGPKLGNLCTGLNTRRFTGHLGSARSETGTTNVPEVPLPPGAASGGDWETRDCEHPVISTPDWNMAGLPYLWVH